MEDQLKEALKDIVTLVIPPRPEFIRLIDVGSERFLDFFEKEILENFVACGGATCRFFEAGYGGGKSHLLHLINHLAVKRRMLVVSIDLTKALSLLEWKDITEHILCNISLHVDGKILKSLPEVLHHVTEKDRQRVRQLRLAHSGFSNAIALYVSDYQYLDSQGREKLKRFLCGEKIGAGELKRNNIRGVKNPLSKRNAESVLNTVLSALFSLGFNGTVILFDETDQTFSRVQHTAKVQLGANLMRRLIDACSNGTIRGAVAVFAVLPDFLVSCSRAYPALGDRLLMYRTTEPGWRFPILRIEDITEFAEPEMFMEKVIDKIVEQVASNKKDTLRRELLIEGRDVLYANPGTNFRRPLLKRLASKTLQMI